MLGYGKPAARRGAVSCVVTLLLLSLQPSAHARTRSFYDRGDDCSGTVSFALHGAGAITAPLPSSDFMRHGEHGRWFTIYLRPGHTFAVIAGLRLDPTDFQNGGNTGPRWHTDARDTRGYVARHPAGM